MSSIRIPRTAVVCRRVTFLLGLWHLTPRTDLERGEYGLVVPGGLLYEFGKD